MQEYDTLCFSGGGTACVSFLGALKYIEANTNIRVKNIKNFAGTSAGAIIGLFLLLGYDVNNLIKFVTKFNFNKLFTKINIDNILSNKGLDNGNKIKKMVSYFIFKKLNVTDITFEELYQLTNKKLLVSGTNYTLYKEELFSIDTTPTMSVLLAIRISISLPIFFTPVYYNNSYYFDGAIINNIPLSYCNEKTTLGLFIKSTKKLKLTQSLYGLLEVMMRCFSIAINAKYANINHTNIIIINPDFDLPVHIDNDPNKTKTLIKAGVLGVKNFLLNKNL